MNGCRSSPSRSSSPDSAHSASKSRWSQACSYASAASAADGPAFRATRITSATLMAPIAAPTTAMATVLGDGGVDLGRQREILARDAALAVRAERDAQPAIAEVEVGVVVGGLGQGGDLDHGVGHGPEPGPLVLANGPV